MKYTAIVSFICLYVWLPAQTPTPEMYGFKHPEISYNNTPVNILLKSKKGEENKVKPLFVFLQGSLPIPLFITDEAGPYGVFPFNPDSLLVHYHLAIIGKPYIPLTANVKTLNPDFSYADSTGRFPKKYKDCNLPGYYVKRNKAVVKYLLGLPAVANTGLVVAGHSEGATNATRLAASCKKVSKLVFISGNPYGRIMSMVGQSRKREAVGDTTTEDQFKYWEYIVDDKSNMDDTYGDTNKATFDFSEPNINYLQKLKIPILVVYGGRDASAPYNDLLRVEMARTHKTNFSYLAYAGLDHNFFATDSCGKTDPNSFGWDAVANDIVKWLKK